VWARAGDKAVLVAISDRENIPSALIFAQYLIVALNLEDLQQVGRQLETGQRLSR
jgi:hypothetical protein